MVRNVPQLLRQFGWKSSRAISQKLEGEIPTHLQTQQWWRRQRVSFCLAAETLWWRHNSEWNGLVLQVDFKRVGEFDVFWNVVSQEDSLECFWSSRLSQDRLSLSLSPVESSFFGGLHEPWSSFPHRLRAELTGFCPSGFPWVLIRISWVLWEIVVNPWLHHGSGITRE